MIAISYRREDSTPIAGRLFDRLQAEFGKGNVFMDFDSISYGIDFREHIQQSLGEAKALVVIIGPHWGQSSTGVRRIDDANDFVRLEVRCALQRGIPVIPVLVNNAAMPKAEELPADIKELAFRNALVLDTGIDFHHHTSRLISGLHEMIEGVSDSAFNKRDVSGISTRTSGKPAAGTAMEVPSQDRKQRIVNRLPRRTIFVVAAITLVALALLGAVSFFDWWPNSKQPSSKEPTTVDIEGLVIDEIRETPIDKAVVKLHFADGETISSDTPSGRFKFAGVDRGKVARGGIYLEASCEGVTHRVAVDSSVDSLKNLRVPLLISGVAISGRVVDANQRPIHGAKVRLLTPTHENIDTIFAENGGFTFANVKVPHVLVRAERGDVNNEKEVDVKRNWRDPLVLKLNLQLPPPFKRTFFTLKGHAVDTFANEKRLPTELAPALGGAVPLISTPPLVELIALMAKFGRPLGMPPASLHTEGHTDNETQETRRREAALKRIEKSQLKALAKAPVLPAAGGMRQLSGMHFDAAKLPSTFFPDAPWSIESDGLHDFLVQNKSAPRPKRAQLDIPMGTNSIALLKFATRGDIDALCRTFDNDANEGPSRALLRFYDFVSRNGAPRHFLSLRALADLCGGGVLLIIESPVLQVRVVVVENTTDKSIELGKFHFRLLDPGADKQLVRTREENEATLASITPDSEPWYKPRMIKPGEKIVIPVELTLRSRVSDYAGNFSRTASERRSRGRADANQLLADKNIQTVALVPLVVMPKQKFVEALLREPVRVTDADEFVYGPSIALDAIEVDGFRYGIEPFDPIHIAYFSSHAEGGSCPFVYCRRAADGEWVKQGTILTGRSSKAREGTAVLEIHGFNGTLRVVEEEDETSYIDELFIRGTSAEGEIVRLRPANNRLLRKDRRYLVLKKGESIDIKFPLPKGMRTDRMNVVASGFFEVKSSSAER